MIRLSDTPNLIFPYIIRQLESLVGVLDLK